MSEQLKIGDRARVVFNKEGRIWGGEGYLYENTSQILGAEGIVTTIHGDEITLTETRTTRLVMAAECLTRVETQRRTFEEIVKALAMKPIIYNELFLIPESTSKDVAEFDSDGQEAIFIHRDGRSIINGSVSADLLAAISAACSEIAANYNAEHGKEEAR